MLLCGLLPDNDSVKGLVFCIASSKKDSLSERLDDMAEPPSDLISSSRPAIWFRRERTSWFDGFPESKPVLEAKVNAQSIHPQFLLLTGSAVVRSRGSCTRLLAQHSSCRLA